MEFHDSRGFTINQPIPAEALPDCESCPKPDLEPANQEAVFVYSFVRDQQMRSSYSGHLHGLRFEAVTDAIRWFFESGHITEPDEVMWRIWTIDGVYRRITNGKIDAASEQTRMESSKAATRR